MHCGVDFDEPTDAEVAESTGGEVTVAAEATERTPAGGPDRRQDAVDRTHDGAREIDAARGAVGSETSSWAASPLDTFTPDTGDSRSHPLLAPLFAFVDAAEWRRHVLIVGLCAALLALVDSATTSLGIFVLVGCILLGGHLFRQGTARETVASGAKGAALLLVGVRGYDAVRLTAGEGVGAAVDLLVGSRVGLAVAAALLAGGYVLDR
jgi:hypothetical protein